MAHILKKNKITQAVILSAGFGTRLRPFTDNIPKVMIPFLGKPLLEWHIERFKKFGINEFFINLHYLPEAVTGYFGDGDRWGVKIIYSLEEPKIFGTAGGMKSFESALHDEFFLIYGDMWSEIDYTDMSSAFFRKPADTIGMMVVGENDHFEDSDLVDMDQNMRFLRIYKKPHVEAPKGCRSLDAAYIFNKKILCYIPQGQYYEIDHELLPAILVAGEHFYGYKTNEFLKDIGTMERYRSVEDRLKRVDLKQDSSGI